MVRKLLMGNEAIALGAIRAGVGVVTGYPGTPSTEVLETVAKNRPEGLYVEWSVNEKAAMEVAAAAAYAGQRTMVTMKQVGLNVASDPLMSLAYVGVKGGMVIVVADDPGPISSQTEQDTRHFARFAKLPVFDPVSPEEAYEMIQDAFEFSEQYHTPVLFRPTTRICHGCASIEIDGERKQIVPEGFQKDAKWVIFPRLTYANHIQIEARNQKLTGVLSGYRFNEFRKAASRRGIAAGGMGYIYVREALGGETVPLLKVATPHPFPEELALEFLKSVDEVLVAEELDPVIERELTFLCGKYHLPTVIRGKLTGDVPNAGELSVEIAAKFLSSYLGISLGPNSAVPDAPPPLPVRPPVLCAGCPHRASFYAVKQAMKGRKAVFSGDIGCYTLGNAAPLDMVDTCLCMGADVTMAQGLHRVEDGVHFAFIGDSTFFASGMTGVANAVYNEADMVLIVLDNSTTAMTGHQPHPGTGKTMMGDVTEKISIGRVLEALGVKSVEHINPFRLEEAVEAVKRAADIRGVSAVIFEAPCIALTKPPEIFQVDPQQCVGCETCIFELGCPSLVFQDGKAVIDASTCHGCGICAQVCPVTAIAPAESRSSIRKDG